jgi:hypothetical protein
MQFEMNKIEQVFIDHFQTLFTKHDTRNIVESVSVVKNKITDDMYQILNEKFTRDEVGQAVRDMKAIAAPGPDGLPALFYHNY